MRKKSGITCFFLLITTLLIATAFPIKAGPELPPAARAKIEPSLLDRVLQAHPDLPFRFLVTMKEQEPLIEPDRTDEKKEDRVHLVNRLRTTASITQVELKQTLTILQDKQSILELTPFWIFNGLAIEGNREAIFELATRTDVATIRTDRWEQWFTPDDLDWIASQPINHWGIERVRADQIWSSLQIDGQGVIVATIDTGVDWNHPALQSTYRGWHDGGAIHLGNWYDTTGDEAIYPVDSTGHGTHVTGLLVGQEGLGMAPGAQWIAVRAFNSSGYAYDSWIHEAFQWILAPAGDPSLAPDIVNNSWSSALGSRIEFQQDVQALVAANILPVFAAGNYGPSQQSIGSPASYADALAVGATDPDDDVASFSSRGPSPFSDIKPEIVAPGVDLYSSLPGGTFGEKSGTSMAAPLVSGLAALLHQADPSLDWDHVTHIMTTTAIPLGDSSPNNDSGWGRIDALGAVVSVLNPGFLSGQVQGEGVGPLVGAAIQAKEHGGGAMGYTWSGYNGEWSLALHPGTYDLEIGAFGFTTAKDSNIPILPGTSTTRDFILSRLPGGMVEGEITDAQSSLPLTATVRIEGTPITTSTDLDGSFSILLPTGTYTLSAESRGHRIGRATIHVPLDGSTRQDLALPRAPLVLLVDADAWLYESEISFFESALTDQDYVFDAWRVKTPIQDTPTITELIPYDVVVWSNPSSSPGYIGAGDVISDYLRSGGNLFISGQNVAFWDSGASLVSYSRYLEEMLKADYVTDSEDSDRVLGTSGSFMEGIELILNHPSSAQNQSSPDSVEVIASDFAEPIFTYDTDRQGGIAAGRCLNYRSVFLSFGLEGAGTDQDRAVVLGKVMDYFAGPRPQVGLELEPKNSSLIEPAGGTVTHTVRLYNIGETGSDDTFDISLTNHLWSSSVQSPTITLSPCTTALINIVVHIPAGTERDVQDNAILTVRSTISPTQVSTATLSTKTPSSLLLVDDDRWYEQEASYMQALDDSGIRYDYYDARVDLYGNPGSPSETILSSYPIVIWFTGYDWYSPLTNQEVATLETYLHGGGRLMLSSQDAMYYQSMNPFSQHYLGVNSHREDITPTLMLGAGGNLDLTGLYPLDYPFRNFSDGLVPGDGTSVELVSEKGWVSSLTKKGTGWKSSFLSFPFESLPEQDRPTIMEKNVTWLSWLGDSRLEIEPGSVASGERVTITATLFNDGSAPVTTVFSLPLPLPLWPLSDSLEGGVLDDTVVGWQGTLAPGEEHLIQYSTIASQTATLTATIVNREHKLLFARSATVWVDAPDLLHSRIDAPALLLPDQTVTYTLILSNSGPALAPEVSVDWWLPVDLSIVPGTLQIHNGTLVQDESLVQWTGPLGSHELVELSVTLSASPTHYRIWHWSTAILDDNWTPLQVRTHRLDQIPRLFFFPLIMHQ